MGKVERTVLSTSISTYVLYEVALQLDKIIALLGPSCRLLDINMCIPYPVETNEARRLVLMPIGWPSKLADNINPTRSNRLLGCPQTGPNYIE